MYQLNAGRRGALLDERSNLYIHVERMRDLLKAHFPWCPVHVIMESVASMDMQDRDEPQFRGPALEIACRVYMV